MNNYIINELKKVEKVDLISGYLPKIKIINGENQTKWLDIDCHTLIQVTTLIKLNNLKK